LKKNILPFEDGSEKYYMREYDPSRHKFQDTNGVEYNLGGRSVRVVLPADLTCNHCILQFVWLDTDPGQHYTSCSDISITE